MHSIIPRGTEAQTVRLLVNNQEKILHINEAFFRKFPSLDFIRIREDEYSSIPDIGQLVTHFNLQVSGHHVGNIYLLPRIIEPGYFDGVNEQLPLLSFEHVAYGECLEVREHVHYDELSETDFEYSFADIKNIDQLQNIILKRYTQSMPHLPREKLLLLGVSKTTLRILGRRD